MDQHDRPLAQCAQADPGAAREPAGQPPSPPRLHHTADRDQHAGGQQRVEEHHGGVRDPQQAAEKRQGSPVPRSIAEPRRQTREKQGTREAEQRGQDPGPPRADAEHPPAQQDAPEEEGRLVAIGSAVEVGNQPVAVAPHLPRDREVAGFVRGQQGTQCEHDGHQSTPRDQPAPARKVGQRPVRFPQHLTGGSDGGFAGRRTRR